MLGVVVLAFGLVFFLYRLHFNGPGFADSPGAWGEFGDYFGGALNPIVGLAALIALLWTLKLQRQELKTSIDELRRTADAGHRQVEVQARSALIQGLNALLPHRDGKDTADKLEDEVNKLRDLLDDRRDDLKKKPEPRYGAW